MSSEARPANANEDCVGPQSEAAGKASSCAGCPNQAKCASGEFSKPDPAPLEVKERFSSIKHTILVLSGKGGVGKSTVAAQLAWGLAGCDLEVGVLDIDICGPSIPRMLGVEDEQVHKSNSGWSPVMAEDNLACMSVGFMLNKKTDAIIWRGPRKTGLIKQFLTDVDWDMLDYLIVDAPPGTSDEHISIAKLLSKVKIDGALIVTTPQEVALLDVRKEITFCQKTKIPILGVVENMSGFTCPSCSTVTDIYPKLTGGAAKMCQEMNIPYLGSIPLDTQLIKACEKGVSFLGSGSVSAATSPLKELIAKVAPQVVDTKEHRTMELDSQDQEGAEKKILDDIISKLDELSKFPADVLVHSHVKLAEMVKKAQAVSERTAMQLALKNS